MKKLISALLTLTISLCLVSATIAPAWAETDRDEIFSQALALLFPVEGNYDAPAALELLLPLAESGDAEAQYYCGWIYDFELEENMETELAAYNWYEKAMEGGILKAFVGAALNTFVESGDKSDELLNYAFSKGFLDLSEDKLGANGLYWIGFMHDLGFGLEQDYEKAFEYYSKSAERRSVNAMNNVAAMAYDGYLVKKDTKLGLEWYKEAARVNHAPAMCSLGYIYYFDSDYEQAFQWFSKAAGLGAAEAMAQLGMMYQSGEGTEVNYELAFEWYNKAVQLGDTHAMCMLGHMYRDGIGVEVDYNIAMDYFIEAAINGNYSASLVVNMMKAANEGMETYRQREAEYKASCNSAF